MSTVTISRLLHDVEQLETPILEEFIKKALKIRAKRIAPSLSEEETYLYKKINVGLSEAKILRKRELFDKRDVNGLTQEEHQELTSIIDEMEYLNVERIKYLVQLANLRNVTLLEIMEELGIKYEHYESNLYSQKN